jgi:phosphoenolpyruvate carboxykinase (GTP)
VFGTTPRFEDLNWAGLEFSKESYEKITSIDKAAWQQELTLHSELFAQLAHGLPKTLERVKGQLEQRLAA